MLHNSPKNPQAFNVLVTGTSSGLGKHLQQAFHAVPFRRADVAGELARLRDRHFQMIVHCAVDARKEFPAAELPHYFDSNYALVECLLDIPHDCFVFVSSHAVYPADGRAHSEAEELTVSAQLSIYGIIKLLAEQRVLRRSPWPLILRCSSLVGAEGRPNNIMRILRRQSGRLFLSRQCPYNLIAYEQVVDFLRQACHEEIAGIFNLGSNDWKTLSEIAAHLGVAVEFGDAEYVPPLADFSKIQATCSAFRKSTLEVAVEVSRLLNEVQ